MKKFYGDTYMKKQELENEGKSYPIKLEYYKIEEDNDKNEVGYGIQVVKTEYVNENINVETKEILNITNSEEQAIEILDILRRYQVTPVVAEDIVEDLLYK